MRNQVVSREEWLKARLELLAAEKEHTRRRDALTKRRMEMPWVLVEKDYRFMTAEGEKTLGELFDGRSQLLIYHFMLGPDWEEGCKSCSFWADNFIGIDIHLIAIRIDVLIGDKNLHQVVVIDCSSQCLSIR